MAFMQRWGRSKIMVLGQGGAGKTALTNSVMGRSFKNTDSTVGITEFTCDVQQAATEKQNEANWGCYKPPPSLVADALAKKLSPFFNDEAGLADLSDLSSFSQEQIIDLEADHADVAVLSSLYDEQTIPSHTQPKKGGEKKKGNNPPKVDYNPEFVMECLSDKVHLSSDLVFSIFDFGGQSVFNVIHHLFISPFGFYIVVFDMRTLASSASELVREESLRFIRFWLNSILIHTRNEIPPIALVGTRADVVKDVKEHDSISRLLYQNFETNDLWPELVINKEGTGVRGKNNHCFFAVDNTKGRQDFHLTYLMKSVQSNLLRADHVTCQKPIVWLKCLEMLMESGHSSHSLSDVYSMANSLGMIDDEVPPLLNFLNRMGSLMWHDEPSLRDVVILNPIEYFVRAASAIICNHSVGEDGVHHFLPVHEKCQKKYVKQWREMKSKGVVSDEILQFVISEYQEKNWEHVTKLMVRFGLMVPLNYNPQATVKQCRKFLVPALLPDFPTDPQTEEWTSNEYNTCYFVFATSELDLVVSEQTLCNEGYFPEGFFERVLSKAVSWSQETGSSGGIKNVTNFSGEVFRGMAVLWFGDRKCRIVNQPSKNSFRLDIEGPYPMFILDRFLLFVRDVIDECMKYLFYSVRLKEQSNEVPIYIDLNDFQEGNSIFYYGRNLNGEMLNAQFKKWLLLNVECEKYDIFYSYRWSKNESAFVLGLFELSSLRELAAKDLTVFVDRYRLKRGKAFQMSFAKALLSCSVFVPIVSVNALEKMKQHNPEEVDNVLLEWILAIEAFNQKRVALIYPIFVGKWKDKNYCTNLFVETGEHYLPATIPTATIAFARDLLQQNNITLSDDLAKATVKNIISTLRRYLGYQACDLPDGCQLVNHCFRSVVSVFEEHITNPLSNKELSNKELSNFDDAWNLLQVAINKSSSLKMFIDDDLGAESAEDLKLCTVDELRKIAANIKQAIKRRQFLQFVNLPEQS
eukprot:Lithocolla_globosa_v1_NODE_34_length_8743_cov_33.461096.p1 type:complete len:975 gc:universal NODE_34_length_8743_cov_33.461096:3520-596(-)